jgi:hypothetical protein
MKPVLVASLVVSLCGALPAVASDDIKVMTLNQYLGGDLGSLIAPAGGDFNAAVVAILEQIAATDFPARVERQAREIARRKPHLIGLQEVLALSCSDFDSADEHGCEDPTIAHAFRDYLDETLDALAAQGADYHDVAIVENLDLSSIQIPLFPPGLPFFVDGVPAFLVAIDRDVILARTDVGAVATDLDCAIPSEDGCNYQFVLGVEVPIPPDPIQVSFERGFVGVDVTVDSKSYRFVNTHLEIREPVPRQFQCEQAAELIETLADTPAGLSLIVVGDLNSLPRRRTRHGTFATAGALHPGGSGSALYAVRRCGLYGHLDTPPRRPCRLHLLPGTGPPEQALHARRADRLHLLRGAAGQGQAGEGRGRQRRRQDPAARTAALALRPRRRRRYPAVRAHAGGSMRSPAALWVQRSSSSRWLVRLVCHLEETLLAGIELGPGHQRIATDRLWLENRMPASRHP